MNSPASIHSLARRIATANVLFAAILVLAYAAIARFASLPIDVQFVGLRLSPDVETPGWLNALAFESTILAGYFLLRKDPKIAVHRILAALFGICGLISIFLVAPTPSPDGPIIHFDATVGLYVWFSNLLYAIVGPPAPHPNLDEQLI